MRLIDADALQFGWCGSEMCNKHCDNCNKRTISKEDVDNAHTIEKRPQDEWIYKDFDVESGISRSYWCSNCGEPKSQWCDDFCQRCGADMRGGKL